MDIKKKHIKIIIFGNSGSGKSTLAKMYSAKYKLSHMDLDTIAWQDTTPPIRQQIEISAITINRFLNKNNQWVIEGGYSDLLNFVTKEANELIFLNPNIELCINNCKKRPWEPHKYASIEEQNENLNMLISWVKEYPERNDAFSLKSHHKLYNAFIGDKSIFTSNQTIE